MTSFTFYQACNEHLTINLVVVIIIIVIIIGVFVVVVSLVWSQHGRCDRTAVPM